MLLALLAGFGRVAGEDKERGFITITDGQVQEVGTGRTKALVECKANGRDLHESSVTMQEAGSLQVPLES
ncbi:uncharacterized protein BJX67DRAFT_339027 [Aspergillus lucknowensis]|uniref:Uncharacterized protein n=1 Tax=Aspergillus lucknowensis TaxID=176173 RepID=A0ABR4M6Q2_9EURO